MRHLGIFKVFEELISRLYGCVYIDAAASSLSNFTKHGLSELFREYVIIVVNTAIGYALVALLLLLQVYKSIQPAKCYTYKIRGKLMTSAMSCFVRTIRYLDKSGKNTEKLTLKCEARECLLQFLI